jgi:hypothetical protein
MQATEGDPEFGDDGITVHYYLGAKPVGRSARPYRLRRRLLAAAGRRVVDGHHTAAMKGEPMTVTVIRTSGARETHELDVPVGERFPAIRALIGATYAEIVNLRDGWLMILDEDGYARRRADNPTATALYHGICRPGTTHRIVGDVAICRDTDIE